MARAGTLGVKGFRSFRTVLNKRFAHFRANFETVGTNGGAQPGRKLVRLNRHRTDQVFQHASDEAAPAGVSSPHYGSIGIRNHYGQAIGSQNGTTQAGRSGDTGIRFRNLLSVVGCKLDRPRTVHLIQPANPIHLSPRETSQALPVFGDRFGAIPDMITKVERFPRRLADASLASRAHGLHRPRCGPTRPQDVIIRNHVLPAPGRVCAELRSNEPYLLAAARPSSESLPFQDVQGSVAGRAAPAW